MVFVHSFWTFLWHWLLLCCLSFIAVAFLRWSHKLLWITKSSVLTAYHLKANREANWWKEKFYFGCWQPRGEGPTPVQWLTLPSLSPLTLSGQELFIGRGRGLHADDEYEKIQITNIRNKTKDITTDSVDFKRIKRK